MKITDLFRLAFAAMRDRKLRTALTILGIVIGPATIVALVAATQGFSNGVTVEFQKLGTTSIYVTSNSRSFDLTALNVPNLAKLQGVSAAIPFWLLSGTVKQGTQTTSVQVMAVDLSKLSIVLPGLSVGVGSVPPSTDLAGAIIGSSIANPNIPGAQSLGVDQVVSVTFPQFGTQGSSSIGSQKSFIIRGVLNTFGQSFFINPDQGIFIPLSEGQSLLHTDKYSGVIVVATSVNVVTQVADEITNLYGQNVNVLAVTSILQTIQTIIGGISTILASIAGISVVVAFIGIMTTMFTTVVERTKEIGVMKAIGYSSKNILSVFLVEALVTGLIGGMIGAGAGAGMSYLVVFFFGSAFGGGGSTTATTEATTRRTTGGFGGGGAFGGGGSGGGFGGLTITPVVTPELIILAIGLAAIVGAIAGLLPAWRASRLSAVEALRSQ